jgi:hypothetical protein
MIPVSEGFTPQCTAEVRSKKEKGRNGMFDVGEKRKTNQEPRNGGNGISDIEGKAARGGGDEARAATEFQRKTNKESRKTGKVLPR